MNTSKMVVKVLKLEVKGFTLLDSLLASFVTTFVVFSLVISMRHIFAKVEEMLFFADFERMYLETQTLAATKGQEMQLILSKKGVSNGYRTLPLPESVYFEGYQTIDFDSEGGNSSLAKCQFQTQEKDVRYQIYLGSGKYKKTESQRVYSP